MYLRYTYNASTALALMNDLVTLFTNASTTDLSTLTTCVTANSTITTSLTVGGWTVHDNPDANSVVLKSAVFDNASKFKYFYMSVATSGYIVTHLFDTWDATAHTGTYPAVPNGLTATVDNTFGMPIVTGTNATLYIYASPRSILMYSLIGSTWAGPYGCAERSRIGAWDTPTNAFCNTVQLLNPINGNYAANLLLAPYVLDLTQAGQPRMTSTVLGLSSIWGFLYIPYGQSYGTSYYFDGSTANGYSGGDVGFIPPANKTSANASLSNSYALTRLNVAALPYYAYEAGSLSDVSNFYLLPLNTGNPEDTVNASGNTFVLMGMGASRLVVPLG